MLVFGALSCASADGEVRGGSLRAGLDASPPPPLVAEFPDAAPTSWRGLYRDFFSPNAASGCAHQSGCHGTPGVAGSLVSGFVCAEVDGCWASLRTAKHPNTGLSLVEDTAVSDPGSARLFRTLRYLEGSPPQLAANGGTMPAQPPDFAFSAEAIERMKSWIRGGAKND
jgi:hypothetical protein